MYKNLFKTLSIVLISVVVLFAFQACKNVNGNEDPPVITAGGDEVRSGKERNTEPTIPDGDLDTLAEGNGTFAYELYRELRQEGKNLFCSPYSISAALAMAYAGARGETENQMAGTLHYQLPQERLHPAFNFLDLELESRGQGSSGADGEGFRLNIVNATWGQKDYAFLSSFLDTLAVHYGAGLRILDFAADTENSRLTINQWVEEQTETRIKDLIPPGGIDGSTRLVLTNAIYFNAAWAIPFEENDTETGIFHLIDGSTTAVPMMNVYAIEGEKGEAAKAMEAAEYQALELPYEGGELSMLAIVPFEGKFDAVEQQLSHAFVQTVTGALSAGGVMVKMPKFSYESGFELKEKLIALGMEDAFSGAADFSGITEGGGLAIKEVIHKAFVAVNEAGTEAAAATAVVFFESSGEGAFTVNLDRPFIYLIRDIETGAVLFLGRVMNPGA